MESKAKLAGHAIHPMLIVFPLGLLATALILDILYLATRNTGFATAAYWDIVVGIIAGLVAAVFGLIDWLAIPTGTRAKRIGALHGIGNVVVVALFAVSWLLRRGQDSYVPTSVAFWLEVVAVNRPVISGGSDS